MFEEVNRDWTEGSTLLLAWVAREALTYVESAIIPEGPPAPGINNVHLDSAALCFFP